MIRLFPYPCDQFDESQSYGAIFKKKGRGLPDAYEQTALTQISESKKLILLF